MILSVVGLDFCNARADEEEFFSEIEIKSLRFWVVGRYRNFYDASNDVKFCRRNLMLLEFLK